MPTASERDSVTMRFEYFVMNFIAEKGHQSAALVKLESFAS